MILIVFCEHDNLSNTCSICCPNPEKMVRKLIKRAKVIQEDCKYIDEGFRCKYCDLEVLTKPSRKTYKCSICMNTSYKDTDPNYDFPRWQEPEDWMTWLPWPPETLRFRRERWNKIPQKRQEQILKGIEKIIDVWKSYNEADSWDELNRGLQKYLLDKVNLSPWYLGFYENRFIFIGKRPGFCMIPKKIFHRGQWITE